MRTKLSKAEYAERVNLVVNHRIQLVDEYNNTFLPILKKFDGKVYNKRFVNELNEALKKKDERLYAREVNQNDREIIITLNRYNADNYVDKESLHVNVMVNKDFRIDEKASIDNVYAKAWLNNFIEYTDKMVLSVKKFDKYAKKVDNLLAAIKEFNDFPRCFRANVEDYMQIFR